MMTTKKPSYKDTYYHLVTVENLEGIKEIIKNQDYFDSVTIHKIQYREVSGLPYLFVTVDSDDYTDRHYAMLYGIYLDINSIIPQWPGKFYLSILIIRETTNENLRQFINPDMDIEHELNHLRQLIDYIDKHPDYIEKSMKYNAGSCELRDLDKSIEFEVRKIFFMEVPTLILDFKLGQNDFLAYDKGIVTKITVNNEDDFLRYKVGEYLAGLNNRYAKRFPKNIEKIKHKFEKEVNKQGKTRFGDNCMMLFMMSLMEYWAKVNTQGIRYEVGEI